MLLRELFEAIGTVGSSTDFAGSGNDKIGQTGNNPNPSVSKSREAQAAQQQKAPPTSQQQTTLINNLKQVNPELESPVDPSRVAKATAKNDQGQKLTPADRMAMGSLADTVADTMQFAIPGKVTTFAIKQANQEKAKLANKRDEQDKQKKAAELKTQKGSIK